MTPERSEKCTCKSGAMFTDQSCPEHGMEANPLLPPPLSGNAIGTADQPLREPTSPDVETGTPVHTVQVTLMPMWGNRTEKVILDGVDISRFVRSVQVEANPNELLQVSLSVFAQKGADFPEQLANVIVMDDDEVTMMRSLLYDAANRLGRLDDDESDELAGRIRIFLGGPASAETLKSYRRRQQRG